VGGDWRRAPFCRGPRTIAAGGARPCWGNPLSRADPWPRTLARLAAIYGACALPFFFAGCAVTLAVTGLADDMSGLYFYDRAAPRRAACC
jgi:hypothetical protein